VAAVIATATLAPALAAAAPSTIPAALGDHLRTAPRLLGDPGGRRTALERAGLTPSLFYNHFLGVLADGGRDDHTRARQSATGDFFLHANLDRALPWTGAEALLQVKGGYGVNVNRAAGALSDPIDDADGDTTYIPQLWIQQSVLDGKVALRAGYLDQQITLDRNAYANSEDRQFLATFLDNDNPAVPLAIGLGATLFLSPTDGLDVILGTADAETRRFSAGFDTAFDGWTSLFGYLEIDRHVQIASARGARAGTYRFGLVWDPRTKERFTAAAGGASAGAATASGDAGFYLSFDQMLYRSSAGGPQGLGAFARYGYRDPAVNRVTHFWSAGVQYHGPLAARPGDVVGLGVYQAHLSADFRETHAGEAARESGVECYYAAQVLPWLTITPDAQVIAAPGAARAADTAVVLGIRWRLTF
jgi:carbohydrate-selective porin OprB